MKQNRLSSTDCIYCGYKIYVFFSHVYTAVSVSSLYISVFSSVVLELLCAFLTASLHLLANWAQNISETCHCIATGCGTEVHALTTYTQYRGMW